MSGVMAVLRLDLSGSSAELMVVKDCCLADGREGRGTASSSPSLVRLAA